MANLKTYLQGEMDKIQMNVVKGANSIDEVKELIGLFERMNGVIETAPDTDVTIAGVEEKKRGRGRKKKSTEE